MMDTIIKEAKINRWDIPTFPANTTHLPNILPMLAHRLRRFPKIGQTWVDV